MPFVYEVGDACVMFALALWMRDPFSWNHEWNWWWDDVCSVPENISFSVCCFLLHGWWGGSSQIVWLSSDEMYAWSQCVEARPRLGMQFASTYMIWNCSFLYYARFTDLHYGAFWKYNLCVGLYTLSELALFVDLQIHCYYGCRLRPHRDNL